MNKIEKISFINIPSVLFYLLPLFLITGPFLSDLSLSLISILYLIYCIKEKNYSFFKTKFFLIFLFFYLYILINSLVNNPNLGSIKISFFYFRFGLFVGAIIFLLENNKNLLGNFFFILLLCFIALTLDGFIQYFFKQNVFGWKISEINRISSFFGDELILGSYLSRLIPIILACGIYFKNQSRNLFLLTLLILIISEVMVFLSGERTAFIYINISVIFVLLMLKENKIARFVTFLSAILLIIIISIYNETAKKRFVDETLEQINLNAKNSEVYIFSKQHNHHYQAAFKMFKDNFLFGVGLKNFRHACKDKKYFISELSCSTHPHNTYIQLASELGIIGLSFGILTLLYFIAFSFKHFIKKFKKKLLFNDFEICLLSAILITLWPIAPTGNFFNNWLSIIYFLPFGIFLWSLKSKKSKQKLKNFSV